MRLATKILEVLFICFIVAFVVAFSYFREIISDQLVLFLCLLFMVKVATDGFEIKSLKDKIKKNERSVNNRKQGETSVVNKC